MLLAVKNASMTFTPLFPGGLCSLSFPRSSLTSLAEALRSKASSWRFNTLSLRFSSMSLNGRQQPLSASPWQEPAMRFTEMPAPFSSAQSLPEPWHLHCSPKPVTDPVVKESGNRWYEIEITLSLPSQMLACYFSKSPQSSVALTLVAWRCASLMRMPEHQGWQRGGALKRKLH